LALYLTPGARVFYFYGKADGRPVEVRLGVWPTMSVEQARDKVRTKVAPDPVAAQRERTAGRETATVSERWDALLLNPYRKRDGDPLRPATLASYKEAWLLLAPLHARRVDHVSHDEVIAFRNTTKAAHGPSATRRALALLSVLLPKGLPKDEDNPRRTILPKVAPRKRYLDPRELAALLRGLDAEPPIWRIFWICALVAPLRRGNLAEARWSEVRLSEVGREEWTVPAERAKGREALSLPIAAPLANLLRTWRKEAPRSEWVFPASATGSVKKNSTHIVNPLHAWKRALLLGSAWRMCEAIANAEQREPRAVWSDFRADLEAERVASWSQRGRPGDGARPSDGKPLNRCVDRLAARCRVHKISPDDLRLRDMKPHDLRRTAGSYAVQGGASMAIVAAALGHSDQRVTADHYGHLNDSPVRDLMNANAAKILVGVEVKP
jgi:integrase